MKRIFITGMSGTGKSSVIEALNARGFAAIDTDYDDWCEPIAVPESEEIDWVWREDRMHALLSAPLAKSLFVSGCKTNQGKFYGYFDHKVLLSAPLKVMLERVSLRSTNSYGQRDEERAEIARYFEEVQPLLRRSADFELDSSVMSVDEIADFLTQLVSD